MRMRIVAVIAGLGTCSLLAETLQERLAAETIPTEQFASAELAQKITSYALAAGDPFLLAYYIDDGSGLLSAPLHVIRYDRKTRDLRRADLREAKARFQGQIPMNCFGSVLSVREYRGSIYIDTHINPSAGCVLILSTELSLKAALSGWVEGLLGSDFAIVRGSEIHFMSVHPMHLAVYDLKRSRSTEVYPYPEDAQRNQFSRLIEPYIVQKWCMDHNAQCDPTNFNTDLVGEVVVNEAARVFGFEAKFDAGGFGEAAEKRIPPRTVMYIYRERGGTWEHREFPPGQFHSRFGMSLPELIRSQPELAFTK